MRRQVETTPRIDSFSMSGERYGIQLTRKANGFGGSQTFFLCPACGQRVRYLYQTGEGFRCRKCAGLSYKCQQGSKRDSMYYYRKGMAYAKKYLRPEFYPLWRDDFCDWAPPPPRYMHQAAYQRRLARLRQYQEKYQEKRLEPWRRLVALLGGNS